LVVALGDPPFAQLSAAPVEAGADVRVAAVAFGDVGPFTAQLQGADGGILSVAAG